MPRLTRRTLLADLGLAPFLLPLFPTMSRAAGATRPAPKRLFAIAWTNGAMEFWPTKYSKTDERDFTLSEVLSPLEPHKKDILLVGGLELTAAWDDKLGCPGRSHHSFPHLLTGSFAHVVKDAERSATGNSISVDQYVAAAIMKRSPTPIRSLELGLFKDTRYYNQRAISFRGPVKDGVPQLNVPDINPFRVYERLFGTPGPTGGLAVDPTRLRQARFERKSAMDFARRQLALANQRLGGPERQRLDQHLTSLRTVEKELDELEASLGASACAAPKLPDPTRLNVSNPNKLPQLSKLQIDLAVAALACNMTRVVTYQMGDAGNDDMTFPFLGREFLGKGREYGVRSHHDIAHGAFANEEGRRRKILVDRWFISQFAYVLERMKEVPEGDGTLLDSSVVGTFNSGSNGFNHMMDRLPWVLGGRAGGYFKTGRYVKLGGWGQSAPDKGDKLLPHNGLLAAMANAMDVPAETFGDPRYGGEPAGLRG